MSKRTRVGVSPHWPISAPVHRLVLSFAGPGDEARLWRVDKFWNQSSVEDTSESKRTTMRTFFSERLWTEFHVPSQGMLEECRVPREWVLEEQIGFFALNGNKTGKTLRECATEVFADAKAKDMEQRQIARAKIPKGACISFPYFDPSKYKFEVSIMLRHEYEAAVHARAVGVRQVYAAAVEAHYQARDSM